MALLKPDSGDRDREALNSVAPQQCSKNNGRDPILEYRPGAACRKG
jgi:hypothetical protein